MESLDEILKQFTEKLLEGFLGEKKRISRYIPAKTEGRILLQELFLKEFVDESLSKSVDELQKDFL